MEPTQEKDGVVRHTVQGVVRRLELLEARVRDLEAAASCPTGSKVNRLKVTRISRGMTQKQLADALGLNSEIWVSRYETGRTKPDSATKQKIAEILGVKKWELFDS